MNGCEKLVLAHGKLRFTAWTRGRGPCVLLLHGFPDLPQTWEDLMRTLDEAGYKAAAVTNRGYETSSVSPLQDYQLITLAEDVFAWLKALGEESVHLIGHDWGAAIASAAAAKHPALFRSLCMVSLPHSGRFAEFAAKSLKQLWMSRYIMLFQLQGTAERKVMRGGCLYLETLWRRWSPGWTIPEASIAAVRERFQDPAIVTAAMSYYRQGADTRSDAGRASRDLANGAIAVPTLGIHGEIDGCIDSTLFRRAMIGEDFPDGVSVETMTGCGHFPHLEQPEAFRLRILDWLRQHDGGRDGKKEERESGA